MTNRIDNSTDQHPSRYVQGGLTDKYNNRLGWWERRELSHRIDDIKFTVTAGFAGRPHLISSLVYGQDNYAWIVLQYNNIVDIATELVPGKELLLPAVNRLVLDIINQPTGGKVVGS